MLFRSVEAAERLGSARAAGRQVGVGEATAVRWVRAWRERGTVEDRPRAKRGSVVDTEADWLLALREAEPDWPCHMVAERLAAERGVAVHPMTVWRFYRRSGLTFKKEEPVR